MTLVMQIPVHPCPTVVPADHERDRLGARRHATLREAQPGTRACPAPRGNYELTWV
jgi:hypothetical protein